MTDTAVGTATGMAASAMADYLRERLEDKVLDTTVAFDQLTVTVAAAALPDAARLCKEDPALGFDFFDFMAGVDERDQGFAVVTHLYSLGHRHHIQLRALADGGRDAPVLPTITHVYRGADWHEREAYDMFGIVFDGHPGLEPRILTIEHFEGWPLRKDFLLISREAKPWPGAKEPGESGEPAASADAGSPATATAPTSGEDRAAAAKAKAERAKAKAAEMRAKKAAERAAAQEAEVGTAGSVEPPAGEGAADGDTSGAPAQERTTADARPAVAVAQEEDLGADEADAEGERAAQAAAAGQPVPAGTPDPTTSEGAAEIADSDIAKDAAAGAVQGDMAAGATGDQAGADEPVDDPAAEAAAGEGAPAVASGTPGIEVEGRHGGAVEQSGDKPAAETTGLDADPPGEAAPAPERTPAPDEDPPDAPDAPAPPDAEEDRP